jgi:hypothetical protein
LPGYASSPVTMTSFSGVQLTAIGMLGQHRACSYGDVAAGNPSAPPS